MKASTLLVVSALATGLFGVSTASAAPASGAPIGSRHRLIHWRKLFGIATGVGVLGTGAARVGGPRAGVRGAPLTIGRGGDLDGVITTPTDADGGEKP
jgi:hypothetical protein